MKLARVPPPKPTRNYNNKYYRLFYYTGYKSLSYTGALYSILSLVTFDTVTYRRYYIALASLRVNGYFLLYRLLGRLPSVVLFQVLLCPEMKTAPIC